MLQAASTVGSTDGEKKGGGKKKIYIKEEKIFTAYLIKKKKKEKEEGKIKRGERSTSRKEFTRLFFLLPPGSLLWL